MRHDHRRGHDRARARRRAVVARVGTRAETRGPEVESRQRSRGATMKAALSARPHSGAPATSRRRAAQLCLQLASRGARTSPRRRGRGSARSARAARAGLGEPRRSAPTSAAMRRRQLVEVEQGPPRRWWCCGARRRTSVLSGMVDAPRVARLPAHRGLVEQRGHRAGVDLAGLPAARAAVEPGGVRVVAARGAVPGEQHERREAVGQAHGLGARARRARARVDEIERGPVDVADDARLARRWRCRRARAPRARDAARRREAEAVGEELRPRRRARAPRRR